MDECPLYADPEFYDFLFPNADDSARVLDETRRARLAASEKFYLEEALRGNGQVLDLGCGTGRLTILIARAGIEIKGADLSPAMLDTARAKASAAGVNVQFVQADMRSFGLGAQFRVILIAGNSLLHLLTREELMQCLRTVRRHLAPGGQVVFDVSNPDVSLLARDPGRRYPSIRVQHAKRGEINLEETASYDAATQVRHIRWYFSSPGAPDFRTLDYPLRMIFPHELLLLLDAAGLRLEARYGEFPREPFVSSSPRQVCICSARP